MLNNSSLPTNFSKVMKNEEKKCMKNDKINVDGSCKKKA